MAESPSTHFLSRRLLLSGAAASGALFGSTVAAASVSGQAEALLRSIPGPRRLLRFTVMGDNTAFARPGVFDRAIERVNWLDNDFVVSVGDLIEGYLDDPVAIAGQWDEIDKSIARLRCPFVSCPGNHDINSRATAAEWERRRGRPYFSFSVDGVLFLILSTEDPGIPLSAKACARYYEMVALMRADPERAMREMDAFVATPEIAQSKQGSDIVRISTAQLNWARRVLRDNRHARWTFVVMHKPAWKYRDARFADIQAMLADRPYSVFAGHTHYFTHEVIGGHDYINMATCGGIRQRPGLGNIDHVVSVAVTPKGPVYANIRLIGLADFQGHFELPFAY